MGSAPSRKSVGRPKKFHAGSPLNGARSAGRVARPATPGEGVFDSTERLPQSAHRRGIGHRKFILRRLECAAERDVRTGGHRAILAAGAQGGMHLVTASPVHHVGDREPVNAAGGQNLNAPGGVAEVMGDVG